MKLSHGTVQQEERDKTRAKCRRWRLCVSVDGVRRSRRFTGTWSEAHAALDAFKEELSGAVANPMTFAEYADRWLAMREASGDYSKGTMVVTRSRVNRLKRSPLAGVRMDAVTPADIEDALAYVREHPGRGSRLSGTSTRTMRTVLRSIFEHAERTERIARNPVDKVRPCKPDTKERGALSPEALRAVLRAFEAEPLSGHAVAAHLMLSLGLRASEALALRPCDVDGGAVHIRGSLQRDGSIGPTKSAAGERTLPAPGRTLALLDRWATFKASEGYGDAPTVCCTAQGRVMSYKRMLGWWTANRDRFGCAGMTLHQLRHSNLSMMARSVPSAFDLQRWAGWSSVKPAQVYVHSDMVALRVAVLDAFGAECPKNAPSKEESPVKAGL